MQQPTGCRLIIQMLTGLFSSTDSGVWVSHGIEDASEKFPIPLSLDNVHHKLCPTHPVCIGICFRGRRFSRHVWCCTTECHAVGRTQLRPDGKGSAQQGQRLSTWRFLFWTSRHRPCEMDSLVFDMVVNLRIISAAVLAYFQVHRHVRLCNVCLSNVCSEEIQTRIDTQV